MTTAVEFAEARTDLRAVDRCDRCGAQARIATQHTARDKGYDVELLWCKHHFNHHRDVLHRHVTYIKEG